MEAYIDYGIYMDDRKSYIVAVHDFERELPTTVLTEERRELQLPVTAVSSFVRAVMDQVTEPHRVLVFGPAGEKYVLYRELKQHSGHAFLMKEVMVSDRMETPQEAQRFTEKHFVIRLSL